MTIWLAEQDLRVAERVFQAVDRAAQKVDGFKLAQPLRGCALTKAVRQQGFERFTVLDARGVVCKARVQREVLETKHHAQLAQGIGSECPDHAHIAVAGRKRSADRKSGPS